MKHKQTRKLKSGLLYRLLPVKTGKELNFSHYNSVEDFDNVVISLRKIYKAEKAPPGFADKVVSGIRSTYVQQSRTKSGYNHLSGYQLRAITAIAACAVFLLGAVLGFGFLNDDSVQQPPLALIEPPAQQENISNNNANEPGHLTKEPTINGEKANIIPDDHALSQNGDIETSLSEEPSVPAADNPITIVLAEDEPSDAVRADIAPVSTNQQTHNGNEAKPDELENEPQITGTVVEAIPALKPEIVISMFNEAEIPNPQVFAHRKRVIESIVIRLTVPRFDSALMQVEDRAAFLGLNPDMKVNEIKDDGTISAMISYTVPSAMTDLFITHLSTVGNVTEQSKNRLDITEEYSRMLSMHEQMLDEVLKSVNKSQELRDLIAELIIFDKRSRQGVQNVVIILEDAVDF